MLVPSLISFLAVVPFLPSLYAYKIDSSCKNQDEDLVRSGANGAFGMANGAIQALQSRGNDPDVRRLMTLLFGQNPDVPRILNVYQGIAAMGVEKASNDDISQEANEVVSRLVLTPESLHLSLTSSRVFYCNVDRAVKRPEGGCWDTVSNQLITNSDDGHTLDECQTGVTDITVAFTWVPTVFPVDGSESESQSESDWDLVGPTQVTICPWFLQWASKQKYKKWADIDEGKLKAGLARYGGRKLMTWLYYTPVDTVQLFDKVLLHELTHTTSAGTLEDVVFEKGDRKNNKRGYGWKAVTALASQDWPGDNVNPYNNADTFALFGSGIRLLDPPVLTYITDDGDITSKNPRSNSKRSLPLELQYRQTPAAFETFITAVKRERATTTGVSVLSL